jgi:hypothetical protein
MKSECVLAIAQSNYTRFIEHQKFAGVSWCGRFHGKQLLFLPNIDLVQNIDILIFQVFFSRRQRSGATRQNHEVMRSFISEVVLMPYRFVMQGEVSASPCGAASVD